MTVGVEPLGATIDDAAGEAFDKVARLLGLPFPGGPHIDRVAREGHVTIDFPRGLTSRRDLERHRFDFSFSGLKTAVARWVEARQASGEPVPVADVAASFQEAVCDVLVRKALDAAADRGIEDLLIGGGVAANSRLRAMAAERAEPTRRTRPGAATRPVHRQRRHGRRPRRRAGRPRPHRPPPSTSPPTPRCRSPPSSPEAAVECPDRSAVFTRVSGVATLVTGADGLTSDEAVSGSRSARGLAISSPCCGAMAYSIAPSTSIRTIDHLPSWYTVNRTWVSSSQTASL